MAILMTDLIRRVRRNIADMDGVGFDDEEIMQWLNDGDLFIRRIVAHYKPALLYREETGTGEIRLRSFPIKVAWVAYNDTNLEYRSTVPERMATGTPIEYYRRWDGLGVYPRPAKPGTWRVMYLPEKPMYLREDTWEFPPDFEPALIEYATVRAQYSHEFSMAQEESLLSATTQQLTSLLQSMDTGTVVMEDYWHAG